MGILYRGKGGFQFLAWWNYLQPYSRLQPNVFLWFRHVRLGRVEIHLWHIWEVIIRYYHKILPVKWRLTLWYDCYTSPPSPYFRIQRTQALTCLVVDHCHPWFLEFLDHLESGRQEMQTSQRQTWQFIESRRAEKSQRAIEKLERISTR